jgi:MFS family permease
MSAESARTEARRQLWLVAVVQVLAMSVWFSAAAVVPSLSAEWDISTSAASWLTTSVQLGFVAGALLSALLNLADRVHLPRLIAASALLAALTNVLIPVFGNGLAAAVPMRFLTGMALAGVYPTGVKLMASWFRERRGLAMGVLVGALTLGSALPHLVNGFESLPWRTVLFVTTGLAVAAALIALALREGPLLAPGARLHPAYMIQMFADRRQRSINLGYFGHMWELYAFWTWLPTYLAASFAAWRIDADDRAVVELVAFGVIGIAGAAGCVIGGVLARRAGSVPVARWALVGSGACCAISGVVFGASPLLLVPVLAIWGFTVIADSAQFSAALSTAANPRYVGTALTAQMAIGFIITVGTIRLLPLVASEIGWRWAMSVLVLGPVAGVVALHGLREAAARPRRLNVLTNGEAP